MAIVAHITVGDGKKAIEYYKAAFGATEVRVMPAEDGKRLMFAELKIGDGSLYLNDDFPEYCGGSSKDPLKLNGGSVTLHMEVPDCDAAMAKAAAAGGNITMPAMDMFWGDRYGQMTDPFGHSWSFSTPLQK